MAQQLLKKFIKNDQIDGSKILLSNAEFVRAKKADGTHLNIFRLTNLDKIEFSEAPQVSVEGTASNSLQTKNQLDLAISAEANARSTKDTDLQNQINAITSGLAWKPSVFAVTADAELGSALEGALLSSVLPFSDDEAPQLVEADIAVGAILVHKGASSAKKFIVYDDAGVKKLSFDPAKVEALGADHCFMVKHDLLDAPAGQENSAIYSYTGTALIKLADVDWQIATGIDLSGSYASVTGAIVAGDSVETAIAKNHGNLSAEITRSVDKDNALQAEIDAEELARANADTTLQNNIDAEAKLRSDADLALRSDIDAEVIARTNEDLTFVKLDGSRELLGNFKLKWSTAIDAKSEISNALYASFTSANASEVIVLRVTRENLSTFDVSATVNGLVGATAGSYDYPTTIISDAFVSAFGTGINGFTAVKVTADNSFDVTGPLAESFSLADASATARAVTVVEKQASVDAVPSAPQYRLSGVADPVASDDVATKKYVDAIEAKVSSLEGLDPMEYKGAWDASLNSPSLANGVGNNGDVYRVTVAGSVNFGAGAISFAVGDKVVYNGAQWEKWDMTDAVASVNGQMGDVVLDASEILMLDGATSIESKLVSLQGEIDAEETARANADTTLQNNINAEATARANEDLTFVKLDGSRALTGNMSFALNAGVAQYKISGLIMPVNADDSANKGYVDQEIGKLDSRIDTLEASVANWNKMKIVLTSAMITNQYVDLAHDALPLSINASVGRLSLHKDEDYTVSVVGGLTRITFVGSIATGGDEALVAGDNLFFTYSYK